MNPITDKRFQHKQSPRLGFEIRMIYAKIM